MYFKLIVVFAACLQTSLALWSCSSNTDCSAIAGSVCSDGACACPAAQQTVLGGTVCADLAPYHTSECMEDFQCGRLLTSFECRKEEGVQTGSCQCQPGFHFFLTRCWETRDFGDSCDQDEQCMSPARDPYSMRCDETCSCADGYYLRQRGECRKIASAVGDGCVIDEDCQFANGVCDRQTFACVTENQLTNINYDVQPTEQRARTANKTANVQGRQHGVACSVANPCAAPFECSVHGSCVCPLGYYSDDNGATCLAELGSPVSSENECVGILTEVRDGVCTCPANFFFDENMRDCVKVTRDITESCVSDINCFTFGLTSVCGEPQAPWGMRSCECTQELSVWDSEREICRLFASIGESCLVDSDCLAGDLEIQCVLNTQGEGVCTCPAGLVEFEGLCLFTGLVLGDECQASLECTGTDNTECIDRVCACGDGYEEVDGHCAPTLGGRCLIDSDCVIQNAVCSNESNTCVCSSLFVGYEDECWPIVDGIDSACNVDAQCHTSLGENSVCSNGNCACQNAMHYRDESCWPVTGLFESCSRTSECFLPNDLSDRAVCRNSQCQCEFDYMYSETDRTCVSSASKIVSSVLVLISIITLNFV